MGTIYWRDGSKLFMLSGDTRTARCRDDVCIFNVLWCLRIHVNGERCWWSWDGFGKHDEEDINRGLVVRRKWAQLFLGLCIGRCNGCRICAYGEVEQTEAIAIP